MFAPKTVGPVLTPEQIDQLAQFGSERHDWRCVDGVPAFCRVERTFTVQPKRGETEAVFRTRIRDLLVILSRSRHPVIEWFVERHGPQRFWARICCQTPLGLLPRPCPEAGGCRICPVA